MSGTLNVILSSEEKPANLPPARGKVKNAWVYWWQDDRELLLRADEHGHILEYVSGPTEKQDSYQKLFAVQPGTRARVAFSKDDAIVRRADVEPQLKTREAVESLSASLAQLGPIYVPRSGKATVQVLPIAEIRLGSPITKLKGDEISYIADFPEPWRGSIAEEYKAAVETETWHPGTQVFTDVANTPNRGAKRTQLVEVSSIGEILGNLQDRANASVRRVNIFTHANPGLISLSGEFSGKSIMLKECTYDESTPPAPIAGALDGTVIAWLNETEQGRHLREELRAKFTEFGEVLLFLCNGGLGRGLSLAQDIAKCFNVRVLAYNDPIGYYADFKAKGPKAWTADRNWTSKGHLAPSIVDTSKESGRIARGYPFVVEAPEDIPSGQHVAPDKKVDKPGRSPQ